MDTATNIKERIGRAEDRAYRAKVNLNIWLALARDAKVKSFSEILDEYDDFFRFTREAHERTFILRVTYLLQPHAQTENLPALIEDAVKVRVISPDLGGVCRVRLSDLDRLRNSAALVSDRAAPHHHRNSLQRRAFAETLQTAQVMRSLGAGLVGLVEVLMRSSGQQARKRKTESTSDLSKMLGQLHASIRRKPVNLPNLLQEVSRADADL